MIMGHINIIGEREKKIGNFGLKLSKFPVGQLEKPKFSDLTLKETK